MADVTWRWYRLPDFDKSGVLVRLAEPATCPLTLEIDGVPQPSALLEPGQRAAFAGMRKDSFTLGLTARGKTIAEQRFDARVGIRGHVGSDNQVRLAPVGGAMPELRSVTWNAAQPRTRRLLTSILDGATGMRSVHVRTDRHWIQVECCPRKADALGPAWWSWLPPRPTSLEVCFGLVGTRPVTPFLELEAGLETREPLSVQIWYRTRNSRGQVRHVQHRWSTSPDRVMLDFIEPGDEIAVTAAPGVAIAASVAGPGGAAERAIRNPVVRYEGYLAPPRPPWFEVLNWSPAHQEDHLPLVLEAQLDRIGLDPGSAPRELVTLLSRVPGLLDTLEQGGQGELLAASVWGSDSGPWRILSLPTPLIYHWALEASRRPVPLEEFLDG